MKYKTIKVKLTLQKPLYDKLAETPLPLNLIIQSKLQDCFYKNGNQALTNKEQKGLLTRTYSYFKLKGGKLEYSKYEFIQHFLSDATFTKLFKKYKKSGFKKDLMPSLIRHKKLKKVEVTTFKERLEKTKRNRATEVIWYDRIDNIKLYASITDAVKDRGVSRVNVTKALKRPSLPTLFGKFITLSDFKEYIKRHNSNIKIPKEYTHCS